MINMLKISLLIAAMYSFCAAYSQDNWQAVMERDNYTNRQLRISTLSTPNPNTSGGDLIYGNIGFFNTDYGIENVRVEGYYGNGQFVDRGGLKIYTRDADGLVPRLTIGSTGYIGIGTNLPVYKLDVNGSARIYGYGNRDFLLIDHQGTQIWRHGISTANTSTYVISNDLGGESANKVLALTHAGNVGIGTTSPAHKLDVNGQVASSKAFVAQGSNDSWIGGGIGLIYHGTYGAVNVYDYSNSQWKNLILNQGGGRVGIGTTNPQSELSVNGTITSKRIKVTQTNWADYVFDSSYHLAALYQVEKYIRANKHLPDIPSAAEVNKDGLDLGDNQAALLKKIEELTLYIIAQDKQLGKQMQVNEIQKQRNDALENRLSVIERMLAEQKLSK